MFLSASSKQCKNLGSFLSLGILLTFEVYWRWRRTSPVPPGHWTRFQPNHKPSKDLLGQANQWGCELIRNLTWWTQALCDHQACSNVGNHTIETCFSPIDSSHAEPRTHKTFWQAGCDCIISCWEISSVLKRCFWCCSICEHFEFIGGHLCVKQGLKHMRSWLLCCFTFDCQAYELSAGHGFTALICNVQGHDHCCCRGAGLPDLLSWCWTTANSGDVVHL